MNSSLQRYAGRVRLVMSRRTPRGSTGSRLGASAGSSLEFHDYRDYHPGDDVRLIDWNVFARSDKETIRRHREEVSPVVELFLDESASMRAVDEPRVAEDLASLLDGAAVRAGCRVRRRRLDGDDPRPPVARSVRIIISDLLLPDNPETFLAPVSREASALHVVRLLPAVERRPEKGSSFLCIDSETGEERELRFDAATLAEHAEALARHTESWTRAVRRHGGTFTDLTPGIDGPDEMVRALVDSFVLEVVS